MSKFQFSPLVQDSCLPLYRQLADQIREGIRQRSFNSSEPLPKEIDIAEALGISRSVVRQAILQLVTEGVLYRVKRKGTFLASPAVEYDLLGFYNFRNEVQQQGKELSIHLVSFQKIQMDPISIGLFQVSEKDQLVDIWRTLLVDGSPILLERTTIPESFVPGITINDIKDRPFLEVFQKYGLKPKTTKKYIEPQLADPFVSREIGIHIGMPVLVIDRYTYDHERKMLARCEWTIRGDRCRHYISLDSHEI